MSREQLLPPGVADDLDPKIRELVLMLNYHGFKTCDSGDGESKFKDREPDYEGGELEYPHVFIATSRAHVFDDLDRLKDLLVSKGIKFCDEPTWDTTQYPSVQAYVEPHQDLVIIEVARVTDDMLPKVKRRKPRR